MLDTGHARRSHQLQASTGWQTPLRRRASRDVLPSTLPAKAGTRSGASSRSNWRRRLLQGGGRADVQPAQAGSLSAVNRDGGWCRLLQGGGHVRQACCPRKPAHYQTPSLKRRMVPPLTGRWTRLGFGLLPTLPPFAPHWERGKRAYFIPVHSLTLHLLLSTLGEPRDGYAVC